MTKTTDADGNAIKLNSYVKRAKSGRYLGRVLEIDTRRGTLRVETRNQDTIISAKDVKLS